MSPLSCKVLIIAPNSFYGNKGGSILMRNIFGTWPTANIAHITAELNGDGGVKSYYVNGRNRLPSIFRVYSYFKGLEESLEGVFSFKETEAIKEFVSRFNPDVIYSQLGPPFLMKLTSWVKRYTEKPLITHVMDDFILDWPINGNYRRNRIPFKGVLNKIARSSFEECLTLSSKRMVISDGMSEEYKRRYALDFDVLNNGIESTKWLAGPVDISSCKEVTIIFAGSINESTNLYSLKKLIVSLSLISEFKPQLVIYTQSNIPKFKEFAEKYSFVRLNGSVSHDVIPGEIRKSDFVLMPFNFNETSVRFCSMSWPTKLSEIFASGKPLLYFGPTVSGFSRYVDENGLGFVLRDGEEKDLAKSMADIFSDKNKQYDIAVNARKEAVNKFTLEKVVEKMKSCIASL